MQRWCRETVLNLHLFKKDTCLSYIILMLYITLNHFFRLVLRHITQLNSRTFSFVMKFGISARSLCSYHAFILTVTKAINPNHLTGVFWNFIKHILVAAMWRFAQPCSNNAKSSPALAASFVSAPWANTSPFLSLLISIRLLKASEGLTKRSCRRSLYSSSM